MTAVDCCYCTANLLIAAVEKPVVQDENLSENISVRIGIALTPDHGIDQDSLCKKADIALYLSKERGKNQYHFYRGNGKFCRFNMG